MHAAPKLQLDRRAASAVFLLLLLASFCVAGEPQYSLDSSFRAPILTTKATAARLLVLPDDRFYAFSNTAPGSQRAVQRLNGEPYGSLVRFMPDGTVDPAFKLDQRLAGQTVNAVAEVAQGKLVVACIPSNPTVDLTNRVLRLNADGSIDSTFSEGVATKPPRPEQATLINAIAVDADGRLLIAGQFGDFNNAGRPWIVRLHPDGGVDTAFAAVALASRWAPDVGILTDTGIAIQPDRKVLFAGAFEEVNGTARTGVARLREDGALDPTFVPQGFVSANNYQTTYAFKPVRSIALQPADGKMFIAGVFNPIEGNPGVATQMIVRLHPNGSADSSFNAQRNRPPLVAQNLRLQADGRPLLAFDSQTGGYRSSGVVRYQPDGAYDSAFVSNLPPSASHRVFSVAPLSEGRAIFAGTFLTLAGLPFSGVARTHADGALDTSFRPGELQREALPTRLAQRRDGRIVMTGVFQRVNNISRVAIALLEREGSLSGMTYPHTLAGPNFFLHPDDKLLLFGDSTATGKFACHRFNADTTIDPTFLPDAETMRFLHANLQADQSYLLSSGLSAQAVANEVWLTRMKPDGSKDASFDLGVDEAPLVERDEWTNQIMRMYAGDNRVLAVLPNGKIIYHYFDRDSLHKIVRLESNGAIDSSFQTGSAAPRSTMEWFPQIHDAKTNSDYQPMEGVVQPTGAGPSLALLEPDGRIILAGQFTSYNGSPAGGIVRLNSDGSLNSTLGNGAAFTSTAMAWDREPGITEIQRDYAGRLLVAGDFDTFHGVPCPGIARLNADGSVDSTFVPPVARRNAGTAFNNRSALARQAPGSFLLAGNYGAAGSTAATSIFRLQIPLRATHMMKTPPNALRIHFTGVPGETYKIEHAASMRSSAFGDSGARVQAGPDGSFIYEDASMFSSLQRFYRAVSLE